MTTKAEQVDELQELAERHEMDVETYLKKVCEDFSFCFAEIWHVLNMPAPHWVQLDIAGWMQHGPMRSGIKAWRGASKTYIACGYTLWTGIHYPDGPDRKVTIVSKSEGHAKGTLHMIRDWMRMVPFFRHLAPIKRKGDRDSATQIDFHTRTRDTREASITAFGIGGQVTGNRSHLIIPDDIETKENTMTREMRERNRSQVTEFESMLLPEDGCKILYLGTPHHEETLYDELSNAGYAFRTWPAQMPGKKLDVRNLAPTVQLKYQKGELEVDDPLWPERFSRTELIQRRAAMGESEYLKQYMLVSGLKDSLRYPLKLRDLIVMDCKSVKAPFHVVWGTHDSRGSTVIEDIPCLGFDKDRLHRPVLIDNDWRQMQEIAMWVDPSGAGEDKTGYAIGGHLNGMVFAKEVDGLEGGYEDHVLRKLAERARHYHVMRIYVENFALQGMFANLMRAYIRDYFMLEPGESPEYPDGWNCSVIPVDLPSIQKEQRIIGYLEPVMNSHRLVVDPDVVRNENLQRQLTRITRQKNCLGHEDELESLANLVAQFQRILTVSPKQRAMQRQREKEQAQLDAFCANAAHKKNTSVIRHC